MEIIIQILQILKKYFDWRLWEPEKRRQFVLNLTWGLMSLVMLWLLSYTSIGQANLNQAYDFLVKKDFESAVDDKKKDELISDAIRIIAFDEKTYEESRTKGFWTPRDLLGKTIINAIKLGAKVVVVDFKLDKALPDCNITPKSLDENQIYLSMLEQAANLAEKEKAVIIVPWTGKKYDSEYSRYYYDLLDRKQHVIKKGSPFVFLNASDRKVRHFRFFKRIKDNKGDDVIFFMPIMAAIYHWYGLEKGDEKLNKAKSQIKAANFGSHLCFLSPDKKKSVCIFSQDPVKECLAARYKFRILPRKLAEELRIKDPLFFKTRILPAELQDESKKIFHDKIVLIGSTYEDTDDMHITPIGDMPGVFLLANGLNIFLKGDQIHAPKLLNYLAMLAWIIIFAFVYTYLPGKEETLIVTGLVGFALLLYIPLSVWMFTKWGAFTDFWFPVTIMGIRSTIANYWEFGEKKLKKFWESKKEEKEKCNTLPE